MKKTYQKPTTNVIAMQPSKIICTSNGNDDYPGPFAYMTAHMDDENLMA